MCWSSEPLVFLTPPAECLAAVLETNTHTDRSKLTGVKQIRNDSDERDGYLNLVSFLFVGSRPRSRCMFLDQLLLPLELTAFLVLKLLPFGKFVCHALLKLCSLLSM